MTESDDAALRTLLEVRARVAPDLHESIVRSLYAIQKRNQYDHDRTQSLNQMDRLIDDYVDRLTEAANEDDPK